MTRNPPSSENSCSDWQACCGGCAAPQRSKVAWFKIQAKHLLQFRQRRQAHQKRQAILDSVHRNALATEEYIQRDDDEPSSSTLDPGPPSIVEPADPSDDLTHAFVRLSNLPTCPLDRLSRYEATLWHQACQILFTLQCLDRRKGWGKIRFR